METIERLPGEVRFSITTAAGATQQYTYYAAGTESGSLHGPDAEAAYALYGRPVHFGQVWVDADAGGSGVEAFVALVELVRTKPECVALQVDDGPLGLLEVVAMLHAYELEARVAA